MLFYRGQGGFKRRFAITQKKTQNGVTSIQPVDLINDIPGAATVTWWFKRPDGTKRSLDWDGEGAVEGDNNEVAVFSLPQNWFNETIKYESQLEVYNDDILVLHSKLKFLVEVEEPSGVHSDP